MSELTGAKISRGILRGKAEKKIHLLKEAFVRLQRIDTEQVTIEGTTELQAALDRTREALEKYAAAIVQGLGSQPATMDALKAADLLW